MAWPKGVPCPDHVKEKISQALIARCSLPQNKTVWAQTDTAQIYWFARVNPAQRWLARSLQRRAHSMSKNTHSDHLKMTKGDINSTSSPKPPPSQKPQSQPTSKGRPANQPD